ncbi:TIGR02281 family clan AA aspartic protease [Actibacterium sp. MT2.3-13A]|uniref:retropepsin-like aspartic protease family protein n=1 Tax=Actibacterium sp. MT2.3-13A TaxID=2828332 RepID=UPI001BA5E118|nr:TIGR02281 family clan AA aspartic protease [Actibacterium sp. MT2.3-13A]
MAGDQIGQLIYLVILAAAIGGYFIAANRRRLGQVARHGALWGLIFVGVIAGAGLWSDIRSTVMPRQAVFAEERRIEVPRAPDGHYYLTLLINGAPVRFVVDTGATDLVLTREDAERAGLDHGQLAYLEEARTANGLVRTARVRLDEVRLGPVVDENMRAVVNGGQMDTSLLGMSYLQRHSRMEFTGDTLILTR